jgi:CubicO group peptidase (beta-lactamase class C family)
VKIIAALLLTAAVGAGLSGARSAFAHERIEPSKIDASLNGFIQSKALVGVSALVYENGQEVYFGAFGSADRESGKRMTRDTLVQIPAYGAPRLC